MVTMRFLNDPDSETESDPSEPAKTESKVFVQKHPYHVKRDKERSDMFKQNQRRSKRNRKQTKHFDASTEMLRSENGATGSFSTPGAISPCSVVDEKSSSSAESSVHVDTLHLTSPDTNTSPTASEKTCMQSSGDNSATSDSDSDSHTSENSEASSLPSASLDCVPTLPKVLDTEVFRNHQARFPDRRDLRSMCCHRCNVNVKLSMFDTPRGMTYCDTCQKYTCGKCVRKFYLSMNARKNTPLPIQNELTAGCTCTLDTLMYNFIT